jgi:hypothetical protein
MTSRRRPTNSPASSPDQRDQLATDLTGEDHTDDIHRLGRGDPVAADERTRDAEPVEHGRDLRPTAVHDHRLDADVPQVDHVLGERPLQIGVDHRVAAELDDDDLAREPLQPREGLDQDMRLQLRAVLPLVVHEEYAEFSCT